MRVRGFCCSGYFFISQLWSPVQGPLAAGKGSLGFRSLRLTPSVDCTLTLPPYPTATLGKPLPHCAPAREDGKAPLVGVLGSMDPATDTCPQG